MKCGSSSHEQTGKRRENGPLCFTMITADYNAGMLKLGVESIKYYVDNSNTNTLINIRNTCENSCSRRYAGMGEGVFIALLLEFIICTSDNFPKHT